MWLMAVMRSGLRTFGTTFSNPFTTGSGYGAKVLYEWKVRQCLYETTPEIIYYIISDETMLQ